MFFSGVFSCTLPPPCTNFTLVYVVFGQCRQGSPSALLAFWPIQCGFLILFVCLQLSAARGTVRQLSLSFSPLGIFRSPFSVAFPQGKAAVLSPFPHVEFRLVCCTFSLALFEPLHFLKPFLLKCLFLARALGHLTFQRGWPHLP